LEFVLIEYIDGINSIYTNISDTIKHIVQI